MTSDDVASPRVRRPAAQTRAAALAVARRLLLEQGPDAVTLKAVASELGMGHANLLHHFGSAAALQSALVERILREAVAGIERAVAKMRMGELSPRAIVDLVFDAYSAGGLGRLVSWVMLAGERERLQPLTDVIARMVRTFQADADEDPPELGAARRRVVADMTLLLTLTALGDSLVGGMAHAATGDGRADERDRARQLLTDMLERRQHQRSNAPSAPARSSSA